jgi:hypothetical protein
LSDQQNTVLFGAQGPVHTGGGSQNNTFLSLTDSRGRSPRAEALDGLHRLSRCFIHPRRFHRAWEVLDRRQTVFLDAAPGSGRTAAAKVLLWERDKTSTIRELPLQGDSSCDLLNLDQLGDGDRVWLDLSRTNEERWATVQTELSALRGAAHERGAYVVVILPDEGGPLRADLLDYYVRIERPAIQEVLRSHLRLEGIPQPLQLPSLRSLHQNSPLDVVPRLVKLISEARERTPAGGFDAWAAAADRALSGRGKSVAAQIAELREGTQRALLITTAMLHGAHADSVHAADTLLLRTVEHPSINTATLDRAPFDVRLKDVSAELTPSGHVVFRELDYDSAVRKYVWTHMPDVREHLSAWLEQVAGSSTLDDGEWRTLVIRFTEQCLNDREHRSLGLLAESLATKDPSPRRIMAAALILQHGLRNEKYGRFFRRQIYDWSTRNSTPDRLVDVIVVACRDEMAVTHPDEAMVRLHHVARRKPDSQAHAALVGLVRDDPRFLRQMLKRLTDPDRAQWAVDIDIFLELANPQDLTTSGGRPLINRPSVAEQLMIGWQRAFNSEEGRWIPYARRWLACAAEDEDNRGVLLEVIIGGAGRNMPVLARLYRLAHGQCIGDLVLRRIRR